jgi:hypothetical protein
MMVREERFLYRRQRRIYLMEVMLFQDIQPDERDVQEAIGTEL